MSEAVVHVGSGKVRELYALEDGRLLLVASDRISTFDVVLPTEIPDKGRVLTGLSAFWFSRTRGICPNHLLALAEDGRSTECRRLEVLPRPGREPTFPLSRGEALILLLLLSLALWALIWAALFAFVG